MNALQCIDTVLCSEHEDYSNMNLLRLKQYMTNYESSQLEKLPHEILKNMNKDNVLDECEIYTFVVHIGNQRYIQGFYPYFVEKDWEDKGMPDKFYCGNLVLKVDDSWYITDFVDPYENPYEIVQFTSIESFDKAFTTSLTNAINLY